MDTTFTVPDGRKETPLSRNSAELKPLQDIRFCAPKWLWNWLYRVASSSRTAICAGFALDAAQGFNRGCDVAGPAPYFLPYVGV